MRAIFAIDHVRSSLAYFAGILVLPFAFGMLSIWAFAYALLAMLGAAIMFVILLLAGGLIFSLHGVRAADDEFGGQRLTTVLAAPVLALCALLLAWPAVTFGADVAALGKLAIHHERYAAVIDEVERRVTRGKTCCGQIAGSTVIVDVGPPIRVAFDPQGLGDNWSALVYDPSGKVSLADAASYGSDDIRAVFGGDMIRCHWLWGDYHRCAFT